jgi:hypothetical protein
LVGWQYVGLVLVEERKSQSVAEGLRPVGVAPAGFLESKSKQPGCVGGMSTRRLEMACSLESDWKTGTTQMRCAFAGYYRGKADGSVDDTQVQSF